MQDMQWLQTLHCSCMHTCSYNILSLHHSRIDVMAVHAIKWVSQTPTFDVLLLYSHQHHQCMPHMF